MVPVLPMAPPIIVASKTAPPRNTTIRRPLVSHDDDLHRNNTNAPIAGSVQLPTYHHVAGSIVTWKKIIATTVGATIPRVPNNCPVGAKNPPARQPRSVGAWGDRRSTTVLGSSRSTNKGPRHEEHPLGSGQCSLCFDGGGARRCDHERRYGW